MTTSNDGPAGADDVERMAAVAELMASLLLREVDADLLGELAETGADEHLRGLGLDLPSPDDAQALDDLAAAYFETWVQPSDGFPPVQSLAEGSTFEGPPAAAMRAIAEAAGVTFEPAAARGAPVDHLGAQLALWAHVHRRDREASREFASRHLRWAKPHLLRHGGEESFYGRLALMTASFIDSLD